jgi:hypothetical protein
VQGSPKYEKCQLLNMGVALIIGCAIAFFFAPNPEAFAKPKQDNALAAAQSYSLHAGMNMSEESKIHNCKAPDTVSGILRGPDGSWRYMEHWTWCLDSTNDYVWDCWLHVKLTGNNKKVKVRRVKNGDPCRAMPKRATFYVKSGRLV